MRRRWEYLLAITKTKVKRARRDMTYREAPQDAKTYPRKRPANIE
jgi:hypothetical protein